MHVSTRVPMHELRRYITCPVHYVPRTSRAPYMTYMHIAYMYELCAQRAAPAHARKTHEQGLPVA